MAGLVKQYTISIDGKEAVASVGQLRDEVKRLEAELDKLPTGSREAEQALLRLGNAKAAVVEIDEAIDGLQIKNRAAAFADFANGVVGAFGACTVAAQTFGLSQETADKYNQKLQTVIALTSSFEAIQRAANSETIAGVKNVLQMGKAYLIGAESASLASKITRAALISTGIGALIVLVGLLAANWDKVTAAAERNKAKMLELTKYVAPPIYLIIKAVDLLREKFGSLSAVVEGVKEAVLASLGVMGDVIGKLFEGDFSGAKERAWQLGAETGAAFAAGVKKGAAEVLIELGDTWVAATIKERARLIAVEQAAGQDVYKLRRQQLEDELSLLKQETDEQIEAYKDKYNEILVLDAEHQKQLDDQRAAAAKERLQKDFEAFKARNQAMEQLGLITAQQRLQRDIEAEKARQEELDALGADMVQKTVATMQQQGRQIDLMDTLLVRFFGVGADQLDAVKAAVLQAAADLYTSAQQLGAALLEGAIQEADAQVSIAQERLQLIDQQLQERQSTAERLAGELAQADGARREYLLQRLSKERAEVQRLAAEKTRAAKAEEAATKKRHELEKDGQKIAAASALAINLATAAQAVYAGVKAVSAGSSVPFPGNLVAIAAGVAAVVAAVASAKQLSNVSKYADGGFVVGPGGPREDRIPAMLSNGEFVVNAVATANNRALLEGLNAGNTRVLAPPAGYANGGMVGSGGAVMVASAELTELISTNRAMLEQLTTVANSNQQIAGYGPAQFQIGPGEAVAIDQQRQQAAPPAGAVL